MKLVATGEPHAFVGSGRYISALEGRPDYEVCWQLVVGSLKPGANTNVQVCGYPRSIERLHLPVPEKLSAPVETVPAWRKLVSLVAKALELIVMLPTLIVWVVMGLLHKATGGALFRDWGR